MGFPNLPMLYSLDLKYPYRGYIGLNGRDVAYNQETEKIYYINKDGSISKREYAKGENNGDVLLSDFNLTLPQKRRNNIQVYGHPNSSAGHARHVMRSMQIKELGIGLTNDEYEDYASAENAWEQLKNLDVDKKNILKEDDLFYLTEECEFNIYKNNVEESYNRWKNNPPESFERNRSLKQDYFHQLYHLIDLNAVIFRYTGKHFEYERFQDAQSQYEYMMRKVDPTFRLKKDCDDSDEYSDKTIKTSYIVYYVIFIYAVAIPLLVYINNRELDSVFSALLSLLFICIIVAVIIFAPKFLTNGAIKKRNSKKGDRN